MAPQAGHPPFADHFAAHFAAGLLQGKHNRKGRGSNETGRATGGRLLDTIAADGPFPTFGVAAVPFVLACCNPEEVEGVRKLRRVCLARAWSGVRAALRVAEGVPILHGL